MRFFLALLFIFLSIIVHAQQEIKSLPIQFDQYMRSYSQINPASSGSLSKFEINTGNQRHGGNWSNINTFYFNANFRLSPKQKTAKATQEEDNDETENMEAPISVIESVPRHYHVIGINFTNDKEGEFLNRTGVYGIYAWHTQLREDIFLAGGASLGMKNYSVTDNYVNGGGSAFAPDGNVGIWMYNYNYHVGFSANQIFNGKLTPLNETTRLIPYYSLTAGRICKINSFFAVKPSLLIRIPPKLPIDINISMGVLLHNLISTSVNYRYKNGITTMLGLENINIGEHNFKMMLSYHIPFLKNNLINIYTYEISLNYFLRPNHENNVIFQ